MDPHSVEGGTEFIYYLFYSLYFMLVLITGACHWLPASAGLQVHCWPLTQKRWRRSLASASFRSRRVTCCSDLLLRLCSSKGQGPRGSLMCAMLTGVCVLQLSSIPVFAKQRDTLCFPVSSFVWSISLLRLPYSLGVVLPWWDALHSFCACVCACQQSGTAELS